MDNKMRNRVLLIVSILLAVGALIMIIAEILSDTKDNSVLYTAIVSIILSNVFNLIRTQDN